VAVARALARRPEVLLLDEPLSALDARTRADAGRELGALLRETEAPALLVTHDFAEAAQLGDRVGIIDRGRVIQEGTASQLAATPSSAFVADFTGAVVLTGAARRGSTGLTEVALDGGGMVVTPDAGDGRVAVSVYPWEIAIERGGEVTSKGSAQNRLPVEVISITTVGNRVRLGLIGPQPLAAEVTQDSVERLGLEVGARVTASWKAAATRLVSV
ncbi:MAG TPA: TOBE domain-containing protein, partial [Thermoleophilaceae bacterium]|nr:TOBE domain-containing protein [Thermoleophilaceae bacterium]